ncbi:MAG: carboxypeptidase regulatory-like domain-containing protein, partial [Acidobacteria bacterium]|nr:carboxypeptidase regulatory-like domain-containing protein [Acidobacteriota bacterium]
METGWVTTQAKHPRTANHGWGRRDEECPPRDGASRSDFRTCLGSQRRAYRSSSGAALRPIYREGRRSLTIAQSVHTNDLGEYRLYWLPPGPYYLSAKPEDLPSRFLQNYIRPPDQQGIHEQTSAPLVSRRVLENGEIIEEVNVPIYFPGTADVLGATPITLRAGDDLRRVDINMAALPPARRIQGTVIDGTTGQPLANGSVRAILQNTGPNVSIPNARIDAKGAFEITGAQPGAYFLFASPSTDGFLGGRGGRASVEVGAKDLENITVIIPPAFDIPGRFIVEGKHDLDMTGLRVSIRRDPDIMGMPFPQQSNRAGT